jgi:type IV pilus assembly protein PilQ
VADAKALASEGELYRAQMDNQLDGSPLYTEFIRLNYARAAGTIGRGQSTTGTTSAGGQGGSTSSSGGSSSSSSNAGGGEGLLPIIKRRLSRRGSIEVDGRSNSLIITDVRQNIDAIKQLVAILDQPEPQVEIEARIVVATRNFSRDIGVQLNVWYLARAAAEPRAVPWTVHHRPSRFRRACRPRVRTEVCCPAFRTRSSV